MSDGHDGAQSNDVRDGAGTKLTGGWSGSRTSRTDASLLVHWVDEQGSVVRLISTTREPDPPPRQA